MRTKRAIHQVMTSLSYGDAISNHAIKLMRLLRSWGHPSEIYVELCDPRVAHYCRSYTVYQDDPRALFIYHYGIGSKLTGFLQNRMNRTILYYHNITPPRYFEPIDKEFATWLKRGRDDLHQLCRSFRGAVAGTEYNRQELRSMGFANVSAVPYLLILSDLEKSANSPAGRRIQKRFDDGYVNILFVSRLAPNKKQEDLLQALAYYQKLIDPRARLLLVGSWGNFRYKVRLEMMAEQLKISPDVHFGGHLELEDGFAGYYKAGSVFLCLSEHEGFGVPLIESMYFDLPVIAYKSSAVPETLGGCGILVTEKRYDVIGELVYNLVTDQTLRQQIIRKQRERLATFDVVVAESQIKAWVESLENA
jgi:glycosyltransferase involved in cell wall biosynthesis